MNENNMTVNKAPKKNTRVQPEPIDLIEVFMYFLNRWYVIIACAVIGAILLGFATSAPVIPMYESSSMLFVARAGSIQSFSDLQLGSSMTEDFVVIARSKPVIDTAIQMVYEEDGVQLTREQAQAAVSVSEMKDTHIIKFTVTMNDPQIACDLCNAITDAMADQIAYIMSSEKPTIVERAEVDNEAINADENNNRQVLMGAAGGLALSVAVLFVMYTLDDKIKTQEDVDKYIGATVLVNIPLDKSQTFKKSKKRK